MDLELMLKAAGLLIGAVSTVYQLIQARPRLRSTLKADLEILKLVEADSEQYRLVKTYVDQTIRQVYGQEAQARAAPGLRVYSWSTLVFGIVLAGGFTVWTFYLVRDGFSWWAVLTGFFALGGIGNIMSSLDPRSGRTREAASPC